MESTRVRGFMATKGDQGLPMGLLESTRVRGFKGYQGLPRGLLESTRVREFMAILLFLSPKIQNTSDQPHGAMLDFFFLFLPWLRDFGVLFFYDEQLYMMNRYIIFFIKLFSSRSHGVAKKKHTIQ